MRVLITGVSGFVGTYLAEHIVESHKEARVWGMVRWNSTTDGLGPLKPVIQLVAGDLTDAPSLVRVLQAARPDVVFHLAAASTVGSSWDAPSEVLTVNSIGQVNLFEGMRTLNLKPLTVIASSAEVYGVVEKDDLPLGEGQPFRPVSPYGVSKATQDLLAYQYHRAYSLPTVRLRLFNHTGPRRPDRFVCSSFARQVAEIEKGLRPPRLEVGDLKVVRDFTDVRDVARAYWLAAIHGRPGEVYNVCSGVPATVRQVLDRLLAASSEKVEVRVDPGRLRTADVPVLYGDNSRFTETTGWRPEIPLEDTLRDLLDWWRSTL